MHAQIIRTDSGYRARLDGDNGEPVFWSEHYVRITDAIHALELAAPHLAKTYQFTDDR